MFISNNIIDFCSTVSLPFINTRQISWHFLKVVSVPCYEERKHYVLTTWQGYYLFTVLKPLGILWRPLHVPMKKLVL